MSIIFIPDPETGELVGFESNDDVAVHAVDGQGKYIGVTTLIDGVVWSPTPPPPGEWAWNGTNWVRDAVTLDELKVLKWAEIKEIRVVIIDAPLVTPYGTFDCDPTARTNITDAVLMLQTLAGLGTPVTIDFTLADNSVVTLDTTKMVTVGLLLGQKTQTVHGTARVLRQSISNAATKEELAAIVWPT